nr:hypothetical protein [Tanacetum cinerariifolium]
NGDAEVISWGLDGENRNKDVDMHKEEEKVLEYTEGMNMMSPNPECDSPDISIEKADPCKIHVWLTLFNVHLEAWSLRGIRTLASRLGKPLMIDSMIAAMCHNGTGRAGYARRTKFVKVKYVWRPIMCNSRKVVGHIDRGCMKKNEQAVKQDQDHGNFKQANNFGNEQDFVEVEEENELIKGDKELIKQMGKISDSKEKDKQDENDEINKILKNNTLPFLEKVWRMSPEIMPEFKKSANKWKLVNKENDKSDDEEDVIEENDADNLNVIADEISGRDTQLIIWNWTLNVQYSPTSYRIMLRWDKNSVNVMVITMSKQTVLCSVEVKQNENPIRTLGDYSRPSHEAMETPLRSPIGTMWCLCDPTPSEPQTTPRTSSMHVPEAYAEAISSNPRPPNVNELPRQNTFTFRKRVHPSLQSQALETRFEARVRDYMAAHTKRIERLEEEKSIGKNEVDGENIVEPNKSNATKTLEEVNENDEDENMTNNEPAKSAKEKLTRIREELVEVPSSRPVGYYLKHKINEKLIDGLIDYQSFNDSLLATRVGGHGANFEIPCNDRGIKYMNALVDQGSDVNVMPLSTYNRLTNEIPTEINIRLSLASHSYIYPLGIAKDVLVEVAGYVYPVDFVILDIKEDEKRPFILGTPFLTIAKAVIKFDKGTITLRFRKNKISFHKIPEPFCRIKKGTKNNIQPIALTMTVNRLILEWEEMIRLHQGKEMEFNQWKRKIFFGELPTSSKGECKVRD